MPHRIVLTATQRAALFALPTDRAELAKRYTLSEAELVVINRRRHPRNRLGFALQLCALRYPGRLLQPGELIPPSILAFVAEQVEVEADALVVYGERENTRYEHSTALQRQLGYRPFVGRIRQHLRDWLEVQAVEARSGFELASWFLAELRRRKVIAPGISVVERLCAAALTCAEREICVRLTSSLDRAKCLDELLELRDDGVSWFAWLRRPIGQATARNFKDVVTRLEKLRSISIDHGRAERVPRHQLERLFRESERISLSHLRGLTPLRRRAILVAAVLELMPKLTDAAMDMHSRIVGRMFKLAERRQLEAMQKNRKLINRTVRLYADIGAALINARAVGEDPFAAIDRLIEWTHFQASVHEAGGLAGQSREDTLDLIGDDYARLRRYAPLLLESFVFRGGGKTRPLLGALDLLREMNATGRRRIPDTAPTEFIRGRWKPLVVRSEGIDRRYYELCAMAELRNGLRSGDIWVVGGRRYRALDDDLLPLSSTSATHVAAELNCQAFLDDRHHRLDQTLRDVDRLAAQGRLPDAAIRNGQLSVAALDNHTPAAAEDRHEELYGLLPRIRITDLLEEVDRWTAFSEDFTHLKSGLPPDDRRLLLTTILADGTNLGLTRMAEASDVGSFWQLARTVDWHVREETYLRATARLVDAQRRLPIASLWGDGTTSSSDGQHFYVGGHGRTLAVINARHGHEPGVNVYSHISDQFGPYYTKVIAATAHEAPHILDGLLQHESSLNIETHHTDTGGFTDHVFALCTLLGVRFAPRIRDLPERRLYTLGSDEPYPTLGPIIAGKINTKLIDSHWDDIVRLVASIRNGAVVPSHILQKLAAFPRQNGLALALRELGRIERTLFILDWLQSPDLRHQTQNGLNKSEERNALAKALFFYRLGRFRDRTYESQQYRASGLNLLIAAIVLWNSTYLERAVTALRQVGHHVPDELLAHVWPLAWDHINITGDYTWRHHHPDGFRPLRLEKMRQPSSLPLAA